VVSFSCATDNGTKRDLDAVNWIQDRDISHSSGRLGSREARLGIVSSRFVKGKSTSVHLFF
jgi:hypothetical protein